MNISIIGLGYVGAVSLACLARDGHRVVGVDIDQGKLDQIAAGRTPVVEEGMVDLMRAVLATGRVSVTKDVTQAVHATELTFVCVGTPSAPNGSQDQAATLKVAHELGAALRTKAGPHVVVFRSTLAPGTVEEVLCPILERESGKTRGEGFHVGFQPEFLREGSSIRDYDKPPFTVVGAGSPHAIAVLRSLFEHLPCEFHATSIRAAEMLKYCCNNFHALKITFANETARLCEALGVDPFHVMDLVCRDTQLNISRAYLRPGFAFGGSCLPKDLRATMYLAKRADVELPMLGGILPSNRFHLEHAIEKILRSGSKRIGMIGLAFKAGTDDLRESPLVGLAEHLLGKGLQLLIYDPGVQLSRLIGANRRFIEEHLPHLGALMCEDLQTLISESDLLVVGMNDPSTVRMLAERVRPDQFVLDLVNVGRAERAPGRYLGLCW